MMQLDSQSFADGESCVVEASCMPVSAVQMKVEVRKGAAHIMIPKTVRGLSRRTVAFTTVQFRTPPNPHKSSSDNDATKRRGKNSLLSHPSLNSYPAIALFLLDMSEKPYDTRSSNSTWKVGQPDLPAHPRRTSEQVADECRLHEEAIAAAEAEKQVLLAKLAEIEQATRLREDALNKPSVPPSHAGKKPSKGVNSKQKGAKGGKKGAAAESQLAKPNTKVQDQENEVSCSLSENQIT